MRRVCIACLCLAGACIAGCPLDEAAEQVGYVPVGDCCEYCDCAPGDIFGDVLDDLLGGE